MADSRVLAAAYEYQAEQAKPKAIRRPLAAICLYHEIEDRQGEVCDALAKIRGEERERQITD